MDSVRRTLVHVLMLLVILSGLNLAFTGSQARADQAACDQIKTDCKNAGFVLGGGARNGLLVDCFQPIVQGTAQPKSASKPLPKINPQLVSACRAGRDSAPVAAPASVPHLRRKRRVSRASPHRPRLPGLESAQNPCS